MKSKKIISILTAALITGSMLSSSLPVLRVNAATKVTQDYGKLDGDPDLRFAVISDIHVTPSKTKECERFKNVFSTINELDENMDALAIVGDLTDNGSFVQYQKVKDIISENKSDSLKLIASMGNHEGDTEELLQYATGNEPRQNIVINGYHFITMSPRYNDEVYGGSTYKLDEEWLREQLEEATKEDPTKPIFVFQHHGIKDTCYGTDDWYTNDLKDVLDDYPQVVDFSGHSHYPLNDPLSIDQEDFTAINTSTTSYFELESGMTYGTIPPNAGDAYQMMVLDVTGTQVRVRKLDMLSGKYIGEDWVFDTSKGKEGFTYTDDRLETSKLPYFGSDATVKAPEIDENGCTLTIDQADIEDPIGDNNDEIVHSYRFDFINKATGEVDSSQKIWSEYYFIPMSETLTQSFQGLKSGTEYEVKVTALNAYGLESTNTISTTFTTAKGWEIPSDEELAKVELPSADMLDVDFTDNEGKDSSETANNMNVVGTPVISYDDELKKNVATFNGSSAYQYQFDDSKYEKMGSHVTMACTVKLKNVNSAEDIFGNTQSSGMCYEITKIAGDNDHVNAEFWVRVSNNGSDSYKIASAVINVNDYVNLVGTYDGNKVKLYVNGELKSSVNAPGTIKYPTGLMQRYCIGSDVSTSGGIEYCSNGTVSSAKLYSTALDNNQVYKLYLDELVNNEESNKITKLESKDQYIKTNTQEGINLDDILFEGTLEDGTTSEINASELNLTGDSSWYSIADGKLTVTESGPHMLEVEKDGVTTQLLVLSKNEDEDEYVLYEENFDNVSNGELPSRCSALEGSDSKVEDGSLVLNATSNVQRVSLPDYLYMFSNYDISADVQMLSANEDSRWASIMYRIQDEPRYEYYQMAVRQNATASNGVEFAQKTTSNTWNVMNTSSYSEALNANNTYKFDIKVYGDKVQEYINDKLMIATSNATEYKTGGIGLQANGCKVKYDNIKITLRESELPKTDSDRYIDVKEINDNISLAPTSVNTVNSLDDMSVLDNETTPANVMGIVNDNLEIVSSDNKVIMTIDEFMNKLEDKAIPVITVNSTVAAEKLSNYLNENKIIDATIISENPEIINSIRTSCTSVRGVLKFNDTEALTNERMMEIVKATNSCKAKTALLNPEVITNDACEYMQLRLISVWAEAKENTNKELYKLINSGVNGIVTSDFDKLVSVYNTYDENSIIREPIIVGHRGTPSQAPENTMDGYYIAKDAGAKALECDIYITKDDQLVIMHDDTVDRTTNGTGRVEDFTLAELKALNVNKQFPIEYPEAKIPTLRELFELTKGTDRVVFVELKSTNPKIVPALKELVEEMGVEENTVTISFYKDQIQRMQELMPWASCGFLNGIGVNGSVTEGLNNVFINIGSQNLTFNPSYGCLNKEIVEELKHRGMTVWPWTYNNYGSFKQAFLNGVYGLTTNYSQWASNWISDVTTEESSYDVALGEKVNVKGIGTTYKGENKNVDVEVIPVENDGVISIDEDNNIEGLKEGTASIMVKTTVKLNDGTDDSYVLYSTPIDVKVSQKDITVDKISTSIDSNYALVNDNIELSMLATGGQGQLKYRFVVAKDGKNVFVQNYSDKNTATWTPKEAGTYKIYYKVRDEKGRLVIKNKTYVVNSELRISTILTDKNGRVGSTVKLGFNTNGGSGDKDYRIVVQKNGKSVFTQNYSNKNTATWTPEEAGTYRVYYKVRDEKGKIVVKSSIVNVKEALTLDSYNAELNDDTNTLTLKIKATSSYDNVRCKFEVIKDGNTQYLRGYSSKTEAKVKLKEAGTYTVKYTVKDSKGNIVSKETIVEVE